MTVGGVLVPVRVPERRIDRHVVASFRLGDLGLQFRRRPPQFRHRRLVVDGRSLLGGLVVIFRHIARSSEADGRRRRAPASRRLRLIAARPPPRSPRGGPQAGVSRAISFRQKSRFSRRQ